VRAATPETTALGAAYLAGLAVGFWRDEAEIGQIWRSGGTFEPRMPESERDALVGGWRRAIERAKGWAQTDPAAGDAS
jgi:glycerol kinase